MSADEAVPKARRSFHLGRDRLLALIDAPPPKPGASTAFPSASRRPRQAILADAPFGTFFKARRLSRRSFLDRVVGAVAVGAGAFGASPQERRCAPAAPIVIRMTGPAMVEAEALDSAERSQNAPESAGWFMPGLETMRPARADNDALAAGTFE